MSAEKLAAIGRVAAGVAHEINNPIAVIRGYAQSMLEEATDPNLRAELAILDQEARSCQRIAEDLLTYSRTPNLKRRMVSVRALVNEAVPKDATERRETACVADVEDAELWVDDGRIVQVLLNLLRNARDAMKDGELRLVGRVQDETYRIEVLDSGSGIPEEARSRVFEPILHHEA